VSPSGRISFDGLASLHARCVNVCAAGFYVDVDLSTSTLPKKVLKSQSEGYNFILVVGSDEATSGTVNVTASSDHIKKDEAAAAGAGAGAAAAAAAGSEAAAHHVERPGGQISDADLLQKFRDLKANVQ
jgi:hypothetical protein